MAHNVFLANEHPHVVGRVGEIVPVEFEARSPLLAAALAAALAALAVNDIAVVHEERLVFLNCHTGNSIAKTDVGGGEAGRVSAGLLGEAVAGCSMAGLCLLRMMYGAHMHSNSVGILRYPGGYPGC